MSDISSELRLLRRGRGVMASDLPDRIGPILRARSGISGSASTQESRERLVAFLDGLTDRLPADLELVFRVALALNHDTQFRFLDQRFSWLAKELNRDVKTISRRFDEALKLIDSADEPAESADQGECASATVGNITVSYQTIYLYRLVSLPPGAEVRVGFITGDIRRVKCADIWVNPENTRMIMPRFEEHSVSAVVRYEGAVRDKHGYVTDDCVASELSERVASKVMVAPGTAIITGAGQLLFSNNVRHIIHVAAVYGEPGEGYRQIRDVGRCVTNALSELDRLNDGDESLRTILIPILGTGVGGGSPESTVPALLDAAIDHLAAPADRARTVLFLAYTAAELKICRAAFTGNPRLVETLQR